MKADHTKILEEHTTATHSRWRSPIARSKWWASVFVLAGPLAVCQLCGQPGGDSGALSTGTLGVIVVALTFVPCRLAEVPPHAGLNGLFTLAGITDVLRGGRPS